MTQQSNSAQPASIRKECSGILCLTRPGQTHPQRPSPWIIDQGEWPTLLLPPDPMKYVSMHPFLGKVCVNLWTFLLTQVRISLHRSRAKQGLVTVTGPNFEGGCALDVDVRFIMTGACDANAAAVHPSSTSALQR